MIVFLYILANSLFWVVVHFVSGYLVHLFPDSLYRAERFLFKIRPWERRGSVYRRFFRIQIWKDRLPEAGALFPFHPFDKSHLTRYDRDYFVRFVQETCRAELSHLLPFLFYPLCLLWNPWPANLIMFAYAVLANIPFVLIQRYNRARLLELPLFVTDSTSLKT
ncbi:MAG: hypothetical protein N2Z76_03330 [Treponemataceae bacterium]|nr:hypothetical protein [Treponemataceae bacterium]